MTFEEITKIAFDKEEMELIKEMNTAWKRFSEGYENGDYGDYTEWVELAKDVAILVNLKTRGLPF